MDLFLLLQEILAVMGRSLAAIAFGLVVGVAAQARAQTPAAPPAICNPLIRYGVAPEALDQCIQVQGGPRGQLTFHALTRGVRYVWRVDAFNDSGVTCGRCVSEGPQR